MSTPTTVKAQIQSLIDLANATTQKTDVTLTEAVYSLVRACGGNVPDTPDEPIVPSGVNLLTYPYENVNGIGEQSGVTITDNEDGSFTFNGELYGELNFAITFGKIEGVVAGETYVFDLDGMSKDILSQAVVTDCKFDYENSADFGRPIVINQLAESTNMALVFVPGVVFDNVTFRPTLCKV